VLVSAITKSTSEYNRDNLRVICLECSPSEGLVRCVPLRVPRPGSRRLDRVLVGWGVNHVGNPGVPKRLDVASLHRYCCQPHSCEVDKVGAAEDNRRTRTHHSRAWRSRPILYELMSSMISGRVVEMCLSSSLVTYAAARPCSRRTYCQRRRCQPTLRPWCRLLFHRQFPVSGFNLNLTSRRTDVLSSGNGVVSCGGVVGLGEVGSRSVGASIPFGPHRQHLFSPGEFGG
jgi:hypothetical protein